MGHLRAPFQASSVGGSGAELLERKSTWSQETWSPCPCCPKLLTCHTSWDKSLNKLRLGFCICDRQS